MSESKLATFRIDKERWDKFVLLAKDNDSNASKLIIGFIDACIDNRIDFNIYTITPPKSTVSNIGIDEYLDSHLDTRIDSYLKKNLSSYLANCIDNSATEYSIETVLDPIIESVEIPVAITKPLITPLKVNHKVERPDWVTKDENSYYQRIHKDPELLANLLEVFDLKTPNKDRAERLVPLGFHTQKGESLASTPVGRIKRVAEFLSGRRKL